MKFLFNAVVIEIGPESDPFREPGFPLTREQYQTIGIEQLAGMLAEAFGADPEVLARQPALVRRVFWMMYDKAGVNAIRLEGGGRARAQFGKVPELAFAGLLAMAANGVLSMAAVDEAVWTKLQR